MNFKKAPQLLRGFGLYANEALSYEVKLKNLKVKKEVWGAVEMFLDLFIVLILVKFWSFAKIFLRGRFGLFFWDWGREKGGSLECLRNAVGRGILLL